MLSLREHNVSFLLLKEECCLKDFAGFEQNCLSDCETAPETHLFPFSDVENSHFMQYLNLSLSLSQTLERERGEKKPLGDQCQLKTRANTGLAFLQPKHTAGGKKTSVSYTEIAFGLLETIHHRHRLIILKVGATSSSFSVKTFTYWIYICESTHKHSDILSYM